MPFVHDFRPTGTALLRQWPQVCWGSRHPLRCVQCQAQPYSTIHFSFQWCCQRLHLTVEELLRRCLVTLPHSAWASLIPELQLTINTTYACSIGCPPYLLMFGNSPPPSSTLPCTQPNICVARSLRYSRLPPAYHHPSGRYTCPQNLCLRHGSQPTTQRSNQDACSGQACDGATAA